MVLSEPVADCVFRCRKDDRKWVYYLVLQRSPPAAIRATGFFIAFLFGFSVSANHPTNNVYNGNDIGSFMHLRVPLQQNAAFLNRCKRFAIIRLQVEHKPSRVQKEEAPPHKKAGAHEKQLYFQTQRKTANPAFARLAV